MANKTGDNLRRLMAGLGLTVEQVVAKTGLDRRTVKAVLDGAATPQPRTIGRLAEGLEVAADEFFVEPVQLVYRSFDHDTNPIVQEVLQSHPDLFTGWTTLDFDELHSRFGTGGPLTVEGTLVAARQMNAKRELLEKFALLLETGQGNLIGAIVEAAYEKVVMEGNGDG